MRSLDDSELVRRFQAGDELAFDELYRRYKVFVTSILRRKGVQADDVADEAQSLWLRITFNFWRIDANRSFKAWLWACTAHLACNYHRSRAQSKVFNASDKVDYARAYHLYARERTPETNFVTQQRLEVAMAEMKRVADRPMGETVNRYFLKGENNREIAVARSIPAKTVRTQIHRFREGVHKAAKLAGV